jgi:hypothetical protein
LDAAGRRRATSIEEQPIAISSGTTGQSDAARPSSDTISTTFVDTITTSTSTSTARSCESVVDTPGHHDLRMTLSSRKVQRSLLVIVLRVDSAVRGAISRRHTWPPRPCSSRARAARLRARLVISCASTASVAAASADKGEGKHRKKDEEEQRED